MPTRKISDIEEHPHVMCRHPEHNPPSMMVFKPGVYEHECPACKRTVQFTVHANHMWRGTEDVFSGRQEVHYVDVGNIPPESVMGYIQGVRDALKEKEFLIPTRTRG